MQAAAPAAEHELFIYYRAPPLQADALAASVRQMQAELCRAHPGLRARLLRRPDTRDGLQTWMEAYALPAGASAEVLGAAIERAAEAVKPQLAGARHVEHFIACAS